MDGKGQQVRSSDVEITPDMAAKLEVDSNYESKYVKKQSDMQRTMKRMLPGLFRQNSLPVTTRCVSCMMGAAFICILGIEHWMCSIALACLIHITYINVSCVNS